MSNSFNKENIKTILKTGFTVPEILDILQTNFAKHYNVEDYASRNSNLLDKATIIQKLINHCEQEDKLLLLCEILIKLRPIKVKQFPCYKNFTNAKDIDKADNIINTYKKIKLLLSKTETVKQALQLLHEKLPNENTIIMFFSEYNQITSDIIKGLTTYNSVEWRSLVNRILEFTDRFENELK